VTYTYVELNDEQLSAEDEALKTKLTGLQVSSSRGVDSLTDVGVWFRWPAREYEQVVWPFITLDLVDVEVAHDREHSYQYDTVEYVPDTLPYDAATPQEYVAVFPTPYNLIYTVAAHTRSSRHDRELFRQLLQPHLLPKRFGFLDVASDNTTRRLDVLETNTINDLDVLGKRVFRRIFTISVSAEFLPAEAYERTQTVQEVIYDTRPDDEDRGLALPNFTIT
jgi:hypothetical protein